jgi:hypothetical protein
VNKSSGTLTLANNVTVNQILTLSSGVLTTGSNSISVTNTAVGAVSIPTTSGSINGTIVRKLANGISGLYQFTNDSTYMYLDGTQTNDMTVTVTSHPNTWPINAGNIAAAIKNYYTITPSTSLTAEKFSLAFANPSENPNSIPYTSQSLFRNSSGTLWTNIGGFPAVISSSNRNVWNTGISQWSNWAIGDGTQALPIQLASFTAVHVQGQGVRLNWRTIGEVNNYGFYVQRKRQSETGWTEIPNSFVAGHGTTNEPQNYSFADNSVAGGSWQYRLRQVDLDGTTHFSEPISIDILTTVEENVPARFALFQNYPNPFNPSTTIKFSVENVGHAQLDVFDITGQKVATLFSDAAEPGRYYTVTFNGSKFSSGVYFYRLQSGRKTGVKKLMLMQ